MFSSGTDWFTSDLVAHLIEQLSFKRLQLIGLAFTIKKTASLFHAIRNKTKANRDLPQRVFPRFVSATCLCPF